MHVLHRRGEKRGKSVELKKKKRRTAQKQVFWQKNQLQDWRTDKHFKKLLYRAREEYKNMRIFTL